MRGSGGSATPGPAVLILLAHARWAARACACNRARCRTVTCAAAKLATACTEEARHVLLRRLAFDSDAMPRVGVGDDRLRRAPSIPCSARRRTGDPFREVSSQVAPRKRHACADRALPFYLLLSALLWRGRVQAGVHSHRSASATKPLEAVQQQHGGGVACAAGHRKGKEAKHMANPRRDEQPSKRRWT